MEIMINLKKILKILIIIVICLVIASLFAHYYKYLIGHDRYLVGLFALDDEWNIPTYYSSITLLFCSILLAIIALSHKKEKNKFYLQWTVLAIIFFILSLDESLQFHEQVIGRLRYLFNLSGIFYFSWVIPGIIFVIVFVLSFIKFLLNLDKKIRFLFIISGIIYVCGAIGMELITGWYASTHGEENIFYAILTDIEESLEMIGVLWLIYTLQSYISSNLAGLHIRIEK